MIKRLLTIKVLVISQLLLSMPSYAVKTVEQCEKGVKADSAEKSSKALSRCLDGVKNTVDRELQTWVNNHIFNLEEQALITGQYSTLKMFKRSQSNFVTFRDNDCRWQYLTISPKIGADNTYKRCYILLSRYRIKELSQVQ